MHWLKLPLLFSLLKFLFNLFEAADCVQVFRYVVRRLVMNTELMILGLEEARAYLGSLLAACILV